MKTIAHKNYLIVELVKKEQVDDFGLEIPDLHQKRIERATVVSFPIDNELFHVGQIVHLAPDSGFKIEFKDKDYLAVRLAVDVVAYDEE